MFRKMVLYGGMLFLAGAVALATPGSGWARGGGGGGHGGGGHFGGGHFGGGGFGGGHFGGGHFGGPHFVGSDGGFRHGGYGYHHYYPYYGGYGYGYYPYYDSYPSYGYDSYPDYGSGVAADSGYDDYASVTPPAAGYQSYYPAMTATAQPDRIAHVTLDVPADAKVWIEDKPTTSTGAVRRYDSPPLTPDSQYTYHVRARWNENGHEVTQTQDVGVTAGAHVSVSFPAAPKAAEQASAAKKG